MEKFLRSRNNGGIYDWHPLLAQASHMETITELDAYPERFATEASKRESKVKLEVQVEEEPPVPADPALAADASRGLPGFELKSVLPKAGESLKKAFGAR